MEYGTRSRTEHKLVWLIMFLIIGALIAFVSSTFWPSVFSSTPVTIGAKTFYADVAHTEELRKIGWAGRELSEDQALLFAYDYDGIWAVKTSGAPHAIDIVWINSLKKVVYIAKNAPPSLDTIYKPRGKSQYVLQLSAGSIDKYNIVPGKSVGFEVEE